MPMAASMSAITANAQRSSVRKRGCATVPHTTVFIGCMAMAVSAGSASRTAERTLCTRSLRCQKDHARLYNSSIEPIYSSCLCDSEHARYRDVDSAVLIDFAGELLAAGGRQLVEAGPAIIVGRAPLGDHPAFQQHA